MNWIFSSVISTAAGDVRLFREDGGQIPILSVRFDGVVHISRAHFNRLFMFTKSKFTLRRPINYEIYTNRSSFQLLNLHGKTLVCYVIALLTAYIVLATVQFHSESKLARCYEAGTSIQLYLSATHTHTLLLIFVVAGYLIFFCFLAAFCWQTVMCFDIWRTFGYVEQCLFYSLTPTTRRLATSD